MKTLHEKWLIDKTVAFSASVLIGADLNEDGTGLTERLERATQVIAMNVTDETVRHLTDSTIVLLDKIPDDYREPDDCLLPAAVSLAPLLASVGSEIELRTAKAKRLPEILITHAVYLLKHSRLSIREFLTWLKRNKGFETRNVGATLKHMDGDEPSRAVIDRLLDFSRDTTQQTRDRIDAVDRLYDALMSIGSLADDMLWWLRICLALRSSLYCWPLMVGGSPEHGLHGISLPIGLFLSQNGESKVYFRISNPGNAAEHRPYVPRQGNVWAHMKESNLQWNGEWAKAFHVGLDVGKVLWRTQNGRLRFVDEFTADAMLNASLVVDLGAACAIVDAVFGEQGGAPYRLTGRSAEAYWVQAVLGMLLPGREVPLGVVTGSVEMADGAYEIHHVEGISKKLEYANDAGFSRVVLPSGESDESDDELNDAAIADGQDADHNEMTAHATNQGWPSPTPAAGREPTIVAAFEEPTAEAEVQAFLKSLAELKTRKKIEINFCPNVRSVADAMQMSGWRRTAFVRLAATQRAFSTQLRRLFLSEQVRVGTQLTGAERQFYARNPWRMREARELEQLDRFLLSETRAIKFVDRERLDDELPGGAEPAIGRWLAWKDHQVRSGSEAGIRGPGLGILCLRSTETDNEIRLWSTIADTLSASAEWWNAFKWSSVDQAAQLLARLLGNRRADPAISSTSAPDVLVLFDEGKLTQRRTNPIFPDDFRGQWLDLLNPSKDDQHAVHYLNEALLREGHGSLGPTRIIVIYGRPSVPQAELPPALDANDREALERLAVFRFDFSIQAAYAVLNYNRPARERLAWTEADERLAALVAKRAVLTTRGRLYVTPQLLPMLRNGRPYSDPDAHLTAAKALVPILEPQSLFIASNRDRTLEPENVLEATWHLHRARSLVPPRDRKIREQCKNALSTLTFLRPFPDWDTVKQLQLSKEMFEEAVELGRELINKEWSITGQPPHSSRVAALLNAMGDFGGSRSSDESLRSRLSDEANALLTYAMNTLEALSVRDGRRQKRKLFSEYAYCMKKLGAPDTHSEVSGALSYLNGTVTEIVSPDFYDVGDFDDYPLSQDWLRARWNDPELTLRERSTLAYVAARLYVGRWREEVQVREPWDQPWIEYFALTTTEDFYASQLRSPLATWDAIYGHNREISERFGQRVCDLASYLSSKDKQELSWWGSKIRSAADNLWEFINDSDPARQLWPREADIALHLICVVVMRELLPGFDFIERRGAEWFIQWPKRLGHSWSQDWNNLAALIVASQAGWVSMLASLSTTGEPAIELVCAWIHAYRYTGATSLTHSDPEHLVDSRGKVALVDTYRRKRATALWNGYQLLARRNDRGWAIWGDLRTALESILCDIDGTTNSWFFAIALRVPEQSAVSGACLMLNRHASETSLKSLGGAGMEGLKARFRWNLAGWASLARDSERRMFETLRRHFTAYPAQTEGRKDSLQRKQPKPPTARNRTAGQSS